MKYEIIGYVISASSTGTISTVLLTVKDFNGNEEQIIMNVLDSKLPSIIALLNTQSPVFNAATGAIVASGSVSGHTSGSVPDHT